MFKKAAMCVLAGAIGAGLLATTQAVSQESKEPAQPNMKEMMKLYEMLGQPGPEHASFKEDVGTWKTQTKMWMGPGEPTVSAGKSKMELIFGGRYLKEHFRCTFEDKPFEGMGLFGYDKIKKKYVAVWCDNYGTGIIMTEGTFDEETKTLTMTGESVDPLMGPYKMKQIVREVSKDKQIFEMYRIGTDGSERKEMEITYTRQS